MLVSELITQTRRLLFTGAVEERNQLAGTLTAGTTSFPVVHDVGSIDRGAKLSINLEDMYVWGKSSQTVTVDRAQFGSVNSAHQANDTVYVNAKFSPFEIFRAINQEILSLSSPVNGLFNVEDFSLDYNPVISGYDFPYVVLDVLDVRYTTAGPSQDWFVSESWELVHDAGADFASGTAIFIRDAYPFQPVNVRAKVMFRELPAGMTASTTLYSIPDEILDILSIGAAYRLTAPREVRRNFDETQGDTRRAGEVPPGANIGASRELGRLRQERIKEEAARLRSKYPARSHRYPYSIR